MMRWGCERTGEVGQAAGLDDCSRGDDGSEGEDEEGGAHLGLVGVGKWRGGKRSGDEMRRMSAAWCCLLSRDGPSFECPKAVDAIRLILA